MQRNANCYMYIHIQFINIKHFTNRIIFLTFWHWNPLHTFPQKRRTMKRWCRDIVGKERPYTLFKRSRSKLVCRHRQIHKRTHIHIHLSLFLWCRSRWRYIDNEYERICHSCGSRVVLWLPKSWLTIALTTIEAKYRVVSQAICEDTWMKMISKDL